MAPISIHALRKESDVLLGVPFLRFLISIHALRKESDKKSSRKMLGYMISIHALRKESDTMWDGLAAALSHFNPRSP